MTDLEDIEGIGPGYADTLSENGYEDADALADADPDAVDELVTTADGADLVERARAAVDTDDDDGESDTDDDYIAFEYDMNEHQRYHAISALVDRELEARRTNHTSNVETIGDAINELMGDGPYSFTLAQLNQLYTGLNQMESEYRSTRGLSDFVGSIVELREYVQELRTEEINRDE